MSYPPTVRRGLCLVSWALGLVLTTGCKSSHSARPAVEDATLRSALETYADIAHASYHDSAASARKLRNAIEGLGNQPSEQTLSAARHAWLDARIPYRQTEVFRFYDGPIDQVELLVNTWPIDESYLESNQTESPGILEDAVHYPVLSRQLLSSLNAKGGETSISTGYHAIEFLLWGRDEHADSAGTRSALDFVSAVISQQRPHVTDGRGAGNNALNLPRRRIQALTMMADLLVEHLERVERAWAKNDPKSYRATFLRQDPERALALAIKGIGALTGGELAGERLTVAYETKDQENEHSCFSDSTHLDVIGNLQGIRNVCRGRYVGQGDNVVSGEGLCVVFRSVDPELGARYVAGLDETMRSASSIPPPFDRAILGTDTSTGRRAIAATIQGLNDQATVLSQLSRKLGVTTSAFAAVTP